MTAPVRDRFTVETEITAARVAFLAADERGDYDVADREYARMDALLEEHRHVPAQR